jgi:hypothetical protein
MAELWKEQVDVPEQTWLNLLQHATQSEIDTFVSLLERNGLKIISIEKYNQVMAIVAQSIKEIEALEYCIKTLMESC